ncbi:HAMP domain-containing protein [Paenibacillus amylolyticus]|nr:HAMP domain-containing protein [Paenibacillus amylolyticus]
MRRVSRGDLDVKLDPPSSSELEFMTRSFNQMTSEIRHLKIDVYEEQLRDAGGRVQTTADADQSSLLPEFTQYYS